MNQHKRVLEINGGRVIEGPLTRFQLKAQDEGYTDAQIDDYGKFRRFLHHRGTTLTIQARFSHPVDELAGTAGFGFWNAPFGDPSFRRPAFPQATWFFLASTPSDLPFSDESPGRGWFAGTMDAGRGRAIAMIPFAPIVILLNQFEGIRRNLWPAVRQQLAISFASIEADITDWHSYQLQWQAEGCLFSVDGITLLTTDHSPRGPLGFVCWMDNQYLILTPRGRLRSGTLKLKEDQWMEVKNLEWIYS